MKHQTVEWLAIISISWLDKSILAREDPSKKKCGQLDKPPAVSKGQIYNRICI